MTDVLARRDRALTPEETEALLRDRLGDQVQRSTLEYGVFTLWISQEGWVRAAQLCRDEPLLAYDMFDNLFAVDAREDGFDVVAILYSTSTGNRLVLRTRCAGGRDEPTCPSITEVYRGADWMERETWDMFGVVFDGHPSLEPRILTVENFEGWPLRKDFHLASRAVKPWPGVKEPAELDEDGNVIERAPRIGDAPGPYELDKAMAEQAKLANPLPEHPATVEGEQVEDAAADADQASDSGHVLSGESEQALEDDQKLTHEADVEVAGDQADDAGEALTEEAEVEGAAGAKQRAEDRRKRQAEARARKAEERAQQVETPAAERTHDADLPSDADSGAKAGTGGPTSGSPAQDHPRDPEAVERPMTGDAGSQSSHEAQDPLQDEAQDDAQSPAQDDAQSAQDDAQSRSQDEAVDADDDREGRA